MSSSQTLDRPSRRHRQHAHSQRQSVYAFTRRMPALLVLLLAMALLIAGGRMSVAGIANYQAEAFMSAWAKAGSEPSARAWQVAHNAAQRANSLYPVANGQYLDQLGRVYSWQQFRQPYAAPIAHASRQAALDAYRAAVAARPTWPYTWERLAHSKLYLQEFDNEFDLAMQQAFQRGPWRIGVNRELAEIGFSAWQQLNPEQRHATLESARRSVANGHAEAQRLLNVAEITGRLSELCSSLSAELITRRKLIPCS